MTSRSKSLKSLTIVPDHLYVMREADRQLDRVISEMGRPGYVLVPRQMGKTNLLLHMRRSRQDIGDRVFYFDLSTRHANLRSFFRSIVDIICEACSSEPLKERIAADRLKGFEPNVEYDIHLRELLNYFSPQRVIIAFDEIDSLIGVIYSDKVLSQIRSMYFARDNYPIYNNLTYVLSGVAEPTDLIKDKNISPFNIGEKIYLESFTLAELSQFLRKSGVDIAPSVIERVFYWTSGNPRMSWDVCSSLEDMDLAGERLTPASADRAVESIYLRNFDRAPVDHIRTLVKGDPLLRDALMSIHYGKAETLDDGIRGRLYLAGITNAPRETPQINNRIAAAALSPDWLTRIAAGHAGVLEAARRHYGDNDFAAAVRLFESYLGHEGSPRAPLDRLQLSQYGIALYKLQRYVEAQQRLEAASNEPGPSELRPAILYYLASSQLKGGNAQASIKIFEDLSSAESEFKILSKLALAGALLSLSAKTHAERIIELSQEVIALGTDLTGDGTSEIGASAYFNLAQAYSALGHGDKALEGLRQALTIAPSDLSPCIYLKLVDALEGHEDRLDALRSVVGQLEQNLPIARRYSSTTLSFSNYTLGALTAKALELGDSDSSEKLITLAKKSMNEPSLSRAAVKILNSASSDSDHSPLLALIEEALKHAGDDGLGSHDIITLARSAVLSSEGDAKRVAFDRYATIAQLNADEFEFDQKDGLICIAQLSLEMSARRQDGVQATISFFDKFKDEFLRASPIIYAFYLNQKIVLAQSANENEKAQALAQETIDLLADPAFAAEINEPGLESVTRQIEENARKILRIQPPDKYRHIGRNQVVRYRDIKTKQEKIAKFKKIERDVRAGIYEIITPNLSGID